MNRKALVKHEMDDLDMVASEFVAEFEDALAKLRNKPVRMYLKQVNRYRLLILRTWMNRYKVPLSYILSVLLPFWEQFVTRHSKRAGKGVLNVTIPSLTGKKSQAILEEAISKDFPGDSQKRLWMSSERERIFNIKHRRKDDDGIKTDSEVNGGKSLLDFSSPQRYVHYYRRKVRKAAQYREALTQEMRKRPYRGNPFREETV